MEFLCHRDNIDILKYEAGNFDWVSKMASYADACQNTYNSSNNRIPCQIDIVYKEISTDQYCTLAGKLTMLRITTNA